MMVARTTTTDDGDRTVLVPGPHRRVSRATPEATGWTASGSTPRRGGGRPACPGGRRYGRWRVPGPAAGPAVQIRGDGRRLRPGRQDVRSGQAVLRRRDLPGWPLPLQAGRGRLLRRTVAHPDLRIPGRRGGRPLGPRLRRGRGPRRQVRGRRPPAGQVGRLRPRRRAVRLHDGTGRRRGRQRLRRRLRQPPHPDVLRGRHLPDPVGRLWQRGRATPGTAAAWH